MSETPSIDQTESAEGAQTNSVFDKLRGAAGTGVGVEDPNIVGDVGPTDTPPGRDPESAGEDAAPIE
jgi:hypothetical protein